MTAIVRPTIGTWWKFNRYELRNGYIVPAPGAQLTEYNPWADYWKGRAGTTREEQQPAFMSLLHLLDQIKALPTEREDRVEVDENSRRAILTWCGQHGLLGLLHHATQLIVLPPRRVQASWATSPVLVRYIRDPLGWHLRMRLVTATGHVHGGGLAGVSFETKWKAFCRGTVEDQQDAGTVIATRGLDEFEPTEFTLEDRFWSDFFPSIPRDQRRTFPYPPPFSVAFWKLYSEPLWLFLAAARLLRDALDGMTSGKPISVMRVGDTPELPRRVAHDGHLTSKRDPALHTLHALTAPCRMTPGSNKSAAQVVWVAPALISAFGAMLTEDLTEERTRRCDECRTVFMSNQPTVRFCSPRCTNTATKRTYRHKRRDRERKKTQRAR